MILVLSPSKTLDFESKPVTAVHTQPRFLVQSETLIKALKKYDEDKLSSLMDISSKLAALNRQRYQNFHAPFTTGNARQALLAFKGDVYEGINAAAYRKADFTFAQKHVRILSGLYGLLRPLDLMQPYRLEMGIKLKTKNHSNLYEFWGEQITGMLNEDLAQHSNKLLVNLASEEYFRAVKPALLHSGVVNIVFKDKRKDGLKIIALFAKKARGLMADYVVINRVDTASGLKDFSEAGYSYQPSLSTPKSYVFTRG